VLVGNGSKADYENALRTVTFTTAGDNPSTVDRSVGFTVSDGALSSSGVIKTVSVTAVNDNPVALADQGATGEDTPTTIDVLANDSDIENDTLSVQSVSNGTYGTVINNGTSVTYTPNDAADALTAGQQVDDHFDYVVSDGNGGTATATVTVTVTGTNDVPVATNDTFITPEDTLLQNKNVLTNDVDPDATSLSVVNPGFITTAHGLVLLQSNGNFTYTPTTLNYNGPDTFTYRATDGTSTSNVATVTINVTPVNDAPVAIPNAYTATGGFTQPNRSVSGNVITDSPADFDVDGDNLRAVLVSGPTKFNNGTFVLNPDGSFTYRANRFAGTDSFTYYVTDGITTSNTVTVGIFINPA
jgi:VCBS repeat-containing protein